MSIYNFGHIREQGVLLLSNEDSIAKHKRNIILAVCVLATLILFPVGLPLLGLHAHKEMLIRWLNKHEDMKIPYAKCVQLEEVGQLVYGGKLFKFNPPSYEDD